MSPPSPARPLLSAPSRVNQWQQPQPQSLSLAYSRPFVCWSLEFNTASQTAIKSTDRPGAPVSHASALGTALTTAAAPVWKGGALLSVSSDMPTEFVQALPAETAKPYFQPQLNNPPTLAKTSRPSRVDNLLWPHLAQDLIPRIKK